MYVHLYVDNKLITAFEYGISFYDELATNIELIEYEYKIKPTDIKIEIKERAF